MCSVGLRIQLKYVWQHIYSGFLDVIWLNGFLRNSFWKRWSFVFRDSKSEIIYSSLVRICWEILRQTPSSNYLNEKYENTKHLQTIGIFWKFPKISRNIRPRLQNIISDLESADLNLQRTKKKLQNTKF